jgi:hypothetical protein
MQGRLASGGTRIFRPVFFIRYVSIHDERDHTPFDSTHLDGYTVYTRSGKYVDFLCLACLCFDCAETAPLIFCYDRHARILFTMASTCVK